MIELLELFGKNFKTAITKITQQATTNTLKQMKKKKKKESFCKDMKVPEKTKHINKSQMLNVWGDKYAKYPNLIIMQHIDVSKHKIVPHKTV